MHIKSLRLQNFQTFKDSTIQFSPTFNCIVGPTRNGKSSCVRALNFLFYNDWYSDYQRFDSDKVIITVELSSGVIITRIKSDSINKIILLPPNGKELVWEGFGVNLPKEIQNILSVFPVEVDNDTSLHVNVADQDDPLFLLYTPPEVKVATSTLRTKVLSRLSGLHWIDYALKELSSDKRNCSGEIQTLQSAAKVLILKLKDFENLEQVEESLNAAREKFQGIKKLVDAAQRVEALISRTTKWKQDYKRLQEIKNSVSSVGRFEKAVSYYEIYQKAKDIIHRSDTIAGSIGNIKMHIQTLNKKKELLGQQLSDEFKQNPTCQTCGSLIDQKRFMQLV